MGGTLHPSFGWLAIVRLEGQVVSGALQGAADEAAAAARPSFRAAFSQVWAEPVARRFTIFVFVSMLAYSAQDLMLEPFAGTVLGYSPEASTSLSGVQHRGVLLGMLAAALAGRGRRFGSLRAWQIGGCLVSALMLLGLAAAGFIGTAWPFQANVFALGVANGAFSIAAIASTAYAAVFGFEAALFVASAVLAAQLGRASAERAPLAPRHLTGELALAGMKTR